MELVDNKVLFNAYAKAIEDALKMPTYDCIVGQLKEVKQYAGLIPGDKTGRVCIPGVAFCDDNGDVRVVTQENPDGELYDQDWYLVVRPLPVSRASKRAGVKIDAYAKTGDDLAKETVVSLGEAVGPEGQNAKYLGAALPYVRKTVRTDSEYRKVIVISREMIVDQRLIDAGVSDGKRLKVCNEWGGTCDAFPYDAVVVTDFAAGKGYRIDSVTFMATHALGERKRTN